MLPTLQFVFNGPLCADAPEDMFAGIGKNGQLVSVARSKGLVVVRMGEAPSGPGSEVSTVLLNQIWQHLNGIMCNSTAISEVATQDGLHLRYSNALKIVEIQNDTHEDYQYYLTDLAGRVLQSKKSSQSENLSVADLKNGMYILNVRNERGKNLLLKFVIQH